MEKPIEHITRILGTKKEAQDIQFDLEERYRSVDIVQRPTLGEQGVYTWRVSQQDEEPSARPKVRGLRYV